MLFGLVVILGSRGSSLNLGSEDLARLVAGVGDPLGGLTHGTDLTVGCGSFDTEIVLLNSLISDDGVFMCGLPLQSVFVGIVGGGVDSGGFDDGVLWLDKVDGVNGLASCLEASGGAGGLVSWLAAVNLFVWMLLGLVQWFLGLGLLFWTWVCVFNFSVLTDGGPAASSV
ncbi:hypothetical protein M0R45_009905 [Rubus argutus]|uniref:NADH dehydrogenase subunit 6 n=1 Tax=Rubus argutus TaxID=59490 RepID=A0AAW1Y623_RUBAR